MRQIAAIWGCAALLVSCAPAASRLDGTRPVDTQARTIAWATVTARASRQAGFAGFDRTGDVLYIGYTDAPERRLAEITSRSDVQAFRAPRALLELDTALVTATKMIDALSVPYFGLAKDHRRGVIMATDVENALKSGPFFCDKLMPIPQHVAGTEITIIDNRACSKR